MPDVYTLAYGQYADTEDPCLVRILEGEMAFMRGPREETVGGPGDVLVVGGELAGIKPVVQLKAPGDARVEIWSAREYGALSSEDALQLERSGMLTLRRILADADDKVAALSGHHAIAVKQPGLAGRLAAGLGMGGKKVDPHAAIAGVPAFADVDASIVDAVARLGKGRHRDPDHLVVSEGDAPDEVLLITSGRGMAFKGDPASGIPLRTAEVGTFVGFVEAMSDLAHPNSLVAQGPVDLVAFKKNKLIGAAAEGDDVGRAVRIAILRSLSHEVERSMGIIDAKKAEMAEENRRQRSTPPPSPRTAGPPTESIEEVRRKGGGKIFN